VELEEVVEQFANAMTLADARRPAAVSPRSGRVYQPGIGPHPEDRAVDLVMLELATTCPSWHSRLRVCYPDSKQTCDWLLGTRTEWAIEIKMSRPNGDNGKPDDTAIKDILSPYASDRSALTDCTKLAHSVIAPRKAILIYGFDDPRRPLSDMIAAFETLARTRVDLDNRYETRWDRWSTLFAAAAASLAALSTVNAAFSNAVGLPGVSAAIAAPARPHTTFSHYTRRPPAGHNRRSRARSFNRD